MSKRQQDPRQTSVDAEVLRKLAEEQARSIEQTSLSAHTPEEIQRILHELRVHQIELDMQNEELRTAQMQIKAGRARYLELYDLAPVGYCTISEKGIILETNVTLTTMLGVNRKILIKKPFSAFILREDQDIYYLLQKESFDTDKPQTCEFRMVRSDQTTFWAFLQATALQDEDGTKSLRVAISDFSKQKMAEQKLRASEAENRAIVELVPDMIFRLGKDGQYLDIETFSDRYLTLPAENLLKKNIKDVFPSEVASLMLDVIRKAVATNTLQVFEYELAVPAGMTIFEARIQKLTDDEVLIFVRDITERKRAEEALHESKQFLRNTLDGLSSHIVVINEGGEIVLTNKAYRDFAERNKIEYSTVSEGCNYLAVCDAAQGENSEEAGFFAQGIREVLSGKRPSFELEYPCHSPDEQRWFLGRVTSFKNDSPRRVIIAHENITARKQAEVAVQEKLRMIVDPEGDISTLELSDIIDVKIMQSLLEKFYQTSGILGAVLDLSGKVVVAFGWQDICTKFHRCHPDTAKNCMESDTALTQGVPLGTIRSYKCKNNLWDMVTPLIVGGRHLGNVFFGQFFYEGEIPDVELFRAQAQQYGFDETEYLAALARVPHLNRDVAEVGLMFCAQMASIVATLSHSAIKQARMLTAQQQGEETLRRFAEELEQQRTELEKRLHQSVKAISKIAELRDVYTAGHQRKVAALSSAIGKEMALSDVRINNLSFGGLLHDVGKFFVPSDILNKPGKVSDLEYKILQTHAEESYNVVKEIDFPEEIYTMIYQHHERLDGSGYPQGISGDEIILESRIIAVADVLEAMSSHRPYRSALGIDAALEEIELHKGTRFDADAVDICIRLFREKKFQFHE